jgi:hypothetical protein
LGAYFASRPLPTPTGSPGQYNIYALPALISLALLAVETLYLATALPETKGAIKTEDDQTVPGSVPVKAESEVHRAKRLNAVGRFHGAFLLFFSGVRTGRVRNRGS